MKINGSTIAKDFNYRPKIRFWMPEGELDRECLIRDIQDISSRGFGGIEIVTENFFNRPTKKGQWNDEQWLRTIEIILEEASHLGLSVDISNGLQWPISSPTIKDVDHPATLYELTYGVRSIDKMQKVIKLPEKTSVRSEGTSRLVSVQAYLLADSKKLDYKSYINLTEFVNNESVYFDFSELSGSWILFAFWGQPSTQKVGNRFYVIDHLSEEGIEENKKYWENSFFFNISKKNLSCLESIFCDSLEYDVSMEWTRDFLETFQKNKAYSLIPFLPVIGFKNTYPKNDIPGYTFTDNNLADVANNDYLDTLDFLYRTKNLTCL